MKLVDILARELKEWPEDARFALFDGARGAYVDLGIGYRYLDVDASECIDIPHNSEVTRAQWQEAREALTSGKNSNLDNPPVGATHYIASNNIINSWWMREPGDNWYLWAEPSRQWALDTPSAGQKNLMKPIHESLRKKEWNGDGLPPVGTVCEAFDSERQLWWHGQVLLHGNDDHAFASGTPECWGTLFWASKFRPIRTLEQIAEEERVAGLNEMIRCIKDHPRGTHGVSHLQELKIHEDVAHDLWAAGYRKQEAP